METLDFNPMTPFGCRPLSLQVVKTQQMVKGCPSGRAVHKWQVFRSICEAKARLGVSDRALAVLHALLSFHPDTVLVSGATDLVVFPSNRTLSIRAHGIAASTLRRNIAVLVDRGLILRRDSPNGKRYARKGDGGSIEQAFGFDLAPFVARADEFAELAETVRTDRCASDLARQRISLLRRDIAKMIATGAEEGIVADWPGLHRRFANIIAGLPRRPDLLALEPVVEALAMLSVELVSRLEHHVKTKEAGGTESQFEHHSQNSNIETPLESEASIRKSQAGEPEADLEPRQSAPPTFPLRVVLEACPDFAACARHGISHWRDFVATAELVRSFLGISPSAWGEARAAMGEVHASVVVAAILQRGSAIKSPGGYLRNLTRKAKVGGFSISPMLRALISSPSSPGRDSSR